MPSFLPERPLCLYSEPPRAFLPTSAPVQGPSLAWDTASLGPLLPPCLQMKHEVTLQQVAVGLADRPRSGLGCWDVGGHFPVLESLWVQGVWGTSSSSS